MAKLVINIPDDVVENESYIDYFGCFSEKMSEIVKNGICKKGHWIHLENWASNIGCKRIKCSECGQVFTVGMEVPTNFCLKCGVELED